MLRKRVIACLDVRDGVVVKGVRFKDHVVAGGILELAARYRDQGADELVFYDIKASTVAGSVDRNWIAEVAAVIDMPFCVAGGIRSVDDARVVLEAGADKVSINSPALARPELITELADAFGSQCVVVGVDSRHEDGEFRAFRNTGSTSTIAPAGRRVLDWVAEAVTRGAGEVVLNCMDRDGMRSGFDLDQLASVRRVCSVPLVASGGAGAAEHFAELFATVDVDGALAAGALHAGSLSIPEVKRRMKDAGVSVRETGSWR